MTPSSVRVRFAPSPTGSLHIGGARTALFNFLFARAVQAAGGKGCFVLRIEDTDKSRNQEKALFSLLKALKWLGLQWDEGPLAEEPEREIGAFGPYRQSLRTAVYQKFAEELIAKGRAYRCFLTEGEEAALRAEGQKNHGPSYIFKSPWRDKPPQAADPAGSAERKEGAPQVPAPFSVRFKNPQNEDSRKTFSDLLRGEVSFPADMAGDFILMRSDGSPVYNFACAVDDGLMKITHVLRGEEHLSNTLRQILLQEALDFPSPQYVHLSLILGEDKKKLSKREDARDTAYFQGQGFLPEALVNFLSLLGWNPGTTQEIFSLKELTESFSLEKLNAPPAVFHPGKLLWMNGEHLEKLSSEDFWRRAEPFFLNENFSVLKERDEIWRKTARDLLGGNFKTFREAALLLKPLFREEPPDESARAVLQSSEGKKVLQFSADRLHSKDLDPKDRGPKDRGFLSAEEFKALQKEAAASGIKGKLFFQPIRAALLGRIEGMEVKAAALLIPKAEIARRLQKTL